LSRNETLGLLPRYPNGNGPIFESPWHAEVLAIADTLIGARLFTADEWSEALGTQLREARDRDLPDDSPNYYHCALRALEMLVARHAPQVSMVLADRVEQWRRAYLNTPHGQPVELAAGSEGSHDHAHLMST
jgi:hypothetical protein